MDPINPIAGNPEALNQTPTQPQVNQPKDTHGITIAAMALFILLALGAVVFLYYQNQQLKNLVASYQTVSSPAPTATNNPVANWSTYTDPNGQFTFKYPSTYTLTTDIVPYLNRNITWRFNNTSLTSCKGDCPVISSKETTTLGGMPATKISGYIGAIGGNIPQNYIAYEAKVGTKYFVFEIQALPFVITAQETQGYDASKIYPISPTDLTNFDGIISTFQFLKSSPTPIANPVSSPSAAPIMPY